MRRNALCVAALSLGMTLTGCTDATAKSNEKGKVLAAAKPEKGKKPWAEMPTVVGPAAAPAAPNPQPGPSSTAGRHNSKPPELEPPEKPSSRLFASEAAEAARLHREWRACHKDLPKNIPIGVSGDEYVALKAKVNKCMAAKNAELDAWKAYHEKVRDQWAGDIEIDKDAKKLIEDELKIRQQELNATKIEVEDIRRRLADLDEDAKEAKAELQKRLRAKLADLAQLESTVAEQTTTIKIHEQAITEGGQEVNDLVGTLMRSHEILRGFYRAVYQGQLAMVRLRSIRPNRQDVAGSPSLVEVKK